MCCLFRNLFNSCGTSRSSSRCDNDVEMRVVNASNSCGCNGCNHGGFIVITNGCGCGCNRCLYNGYSTAQNTCSCNGYNGYDYDYDYSNSCGCGCNG